jgi:hypothetical protein
LPAAVLAQGPLPYDHKPPGQIVKTVTVYLAGEAMNSRYQAVLSRVQIAPAKGQTAARYQPYLTIYQQSADTFVQMYQAPGKNDYLDLLGQIQPIPSAPGMYEPSVEDVKLVGAGEFMQPTVQQLVVQAYSAGADCGATAVHVIALRSEGHALVDSLKVSNYCDLSASIVGNTIKLDGPYYGKDAPLCCPTKNSATATATYDMRRHTWTVSPRYFEVVQTSPAMPSH